ncbi:hypothetical protein [Sphingopyxis sp.]|uniref:hypothetical protein n=1 Tax=Sphingopyxis sp. TaxID=1908224 RepID=UPI003F6FBCFE
MGIDLDALRAEAQRDGETCVVTRRWLRQVLSQLEAPKPAPAAIALDHKTLERR